MSFENISQAPVAAPVVPSSVDTSDIEDFSQRIHLVQEAANAEAKASYRESAESEEPDEVAEEVETANAPPKDSEPEPLAAVANVQSTPSPEEKARKASLANAARLERESVRRSTELAAKATELKLKENTFAEREAKLASFEKAYNDPDALLSLLSEKIAPEKMAQFFLEAGQPDKVAERKAKAAQEPVSAEMQKLREEMKALKQEAEAAKAQVARAASEKDFSERVLELKSEVPYAAKLLNKRPKEFLAMADMAASKLMAKAKAEGTDASWDDVIQDVNTQLADFARDLQDEASVAAVPSTSEKPTKSPAAAKASTVSNLAASARSTILGEDDKWESLPFAERVLRAQKRARLAD